jgi:hypothetical protein
MFEKVYMTNDESCFMSTRGLSESQRTQSVRMMSVLDHKDESPKALDLKDVCELDGFSHKALFSTELGQLALYNYCMGMAIHVINVRLATAYQASMDGMGHKASTRAYIIHPQDENDFQNSVYMGVFENLTPEKCGRELDVKEFAMLVADVAYLFHDKYAYRHNRTGMDISMDGYGTTEDGARVNLLSYDYLTEKRVNAQVENALKNERAMKSADDLYSSYKTMLESVFNKSDLRDFERLYKLRANAQTMTSTQRNRLNYLIRSASARHKVITGQAHDFKMALKMNNRALKKQAKKAADAKKAMTKLSNRRARYDERCRLFLKNINALLMKTPSDNPHQKALHDLWVKVNAYQPKDTEDDRALAPFRAEFKALKLNIKGHSMELQGIKQATKKALKKVSV